MPRDATHGNIADRVAAALREEAPFLGQYRSLVQIGSVFPDAGFFIRAKHNAPPEVRQLADVIHGSLGEDTFSLVRALAGDPATAKDEPLQALLIGIITHLWADIVFHPLVYFVSGDYADNALAKARHHDFETVLELYTDIEWGGDGFPLSTFLKNAERFGFETLLGRIFAHWPESFAQRSEATRVYNKAFRFFAWARCQFKSRWARCIYPLMLRFDPATAALVHSGGKRQRFDEMRQEFAYRNPVTGETFAATVEDLRDRTVIQCASFCRDLVFPVIRGEKPASAIPVGPSLSFGLVGVKDSDARFFADQPWSIS